VTAALEPTPAGDVVAAALARAPLPTPAALARLAAVFGRVAVVDLETTGLDPDSARIVEVAAVEVDASGDVRFFQRLVDPEVPIPALTTRLTGLAAADVAGAAPWREVARELAERVSGAAIVAHNAAFERAFLEGLLPRGTLFLDTLELACVLRPELSGHSLAALVQGWFARGECHRALDDALDALAVLCRLHDEIDAGAFAPVGELLAEAQPDWEWAPLFGDRSASRLGGLGRAALRAPLPLRAATGRAPGPAPSIPAHWYDEDFLVRTLRDEALWQRVVPEYRVRQGQIDLACALLEAFKTDRCVAAEAGTGIGKTLAYCLVSVLHALATGERVVVSSANRTLQERLVREELPRVAGALGIPTPPALVLKGRANYGSPRRARDLAARPADFGFGALSAAGRLYLTSAAGCMAERDLQSFGGWMLSRDRLLFAVRDRLACSTECDERACRTAADGPCGYLRRVDALGDVSLISTNHALLLRWPARYGAIGRLIIDEAHELASEGDRAFGEEIDARALRAWMEQLGGGGRGGIVGALGLGADEGPDASLAVLGCEAAIEEVGVALLRVAGSREQIVPAPGTAASSEAWEEAARAVERLADQLTALGAMLDEMALVYRFRHGLAPSGGDDDALVGEAASLSLQIASAGRGLLRDVFVQARPDAVYAARSSLRRDQRYDWRISATPLDVADLIRARVLESATSVAALSATLGIGGDPSPSLDKMGWNGLPAERRMPPLVIRSPFDFQGRAVLAFARIGAYRDAQFPDRCAAAIARIARLLEGRTMALFTSRQRLGDVTARLTRLLAELGVPVWVQARSGGAARLVQQFNADPRAVLAGTRSLWQGVDIPGAALSCVVIDKLPFPPPDEPLARGRARLVREAGGDPFRILSLEPAVISFKQMFGRLIRGEGDRGFVVVLGADPTKAYIDDFVASLPGPPRVLVGDVDAILGAMESFFASGGA
jgi:Rad3-related DNA helicase/DNA polymerase III epsilon subunit-like protein